MRLRYQGIDLETYYKSILIAQKKKLENTWKGAATKRVKTDLVLAGNS